MEIIAERLIKGWESRLQRSLVALYSEIQIKKDWFWWKDGSGSEETQVKAPEPLLKDDKAYPSQVGMLDPGWVNESAARYTAVQATT